jgi:hypothetical protein
MFGSMFSSQCLEATEVPPIELRLLQRERERENKEIKRVNE